MEELFEAIPDGWTTGKPSYNPNAHAFEMSAFDQRDKVKVGHRTGAWTAVTPTEDAVVREMARCPREIAAGKVQK